jgi:hypothetical protein
VALDWLGRLMVACVAYLVGAALLGVAASLIDLAAAWRRARR